MTYEHNIFGIFKGADEILEPIIGDEDRVIIVLMLLAVRLDQNFIREWLEFLDDGVLVFSRIWREDCCDEFEIGFLGLEFGSEGFHERPEGLERVPFGVGYVGTIKDNSVVRNECGEDGFDEVSLVLL